MKTLDLLSSQRPLVLGGFFTWNGGRDDPHVYMRPAHTGKEDEICRLASYDAAKGSLTVNTNAFDERGSRLLAESKGADLIIMDELGFLESDAAVFRRAVMDTLAGGVPVLGVMRLGDVPWHEAIKRHPSVTIIDVSEKNRNALPQELAAALA